MDVSNNMRDKVMLALTVCQGYRLCDPDHCPYGDKVDGHACLDSLHEDTYALLKAQEPVSPQIKNGLYICGNCGRGFAEMVPCGAPTHRANFCEKCGRKVKWE